MIFPSLLRPSSRFYHWTATVFLAVISLTVQAADETPRSQHSESIAGYERFYMFVPHIVVFVNQYNCTITVLYLPKVCIRPI